MALLIPPRTADPVKAVTGAGVTALTYGTPLWSVARTPQQRAYQAARLYAENYLIRLAETPVSGKGGSLEYNGATGTRPGWHLEDEQGEPVTEDSDPALKAIRDLLQHPQDALAEDDRQPGMEDWAGFSTSTLRHEGLCGTTFWYLDQTEALGGTPLAFLYLAPWRMYEVQHRDTGRLLGWSLDKPLNEGGTPLERGNVVPFYLQPPDQGNWASGLVEAAGAKAAIDPLVDRHIQRVLSSGGRLTGLISPKENAVVTDDQWAQFIRDYRGITQDPDAAMRLQIVKGAVDYVQTSSTMHDLQVVEVDARTRDAVLGLWGVPRSQASITAAQGLNSGETKSYDEAILWQGAIHSRLRPFRATIQRRILDRYKALGITVRLVIDEPEFDDDKPLYEKAQLAAGLPFTRNERRDIVGKDPLPDWDEVTGEPLGVAIDLPFNVSVVGAGPSDTPRPVPTVTVIEPPPPALLGPGPQPPDAMPMPMKASVTRFAVLRRQVDSRVVPKLQRIVADVLARQKADVIRYLRSVGLDHLRRKLDFRWNPRDEDARLHAALKPEVGRIVQKVATRTEAALRPAKADVDFMDRVTDRVLSRGAARVRGINQTTREAIQAALQEALPETGTIDDVIAAVENLSVFDASRSEVIARTESMLAYNDAALGSYAELGVSEVEAIDGDDDPECAERDGRVFSVEEAAGIEDHPNGTLDWAPIVEDEPPQKAAPVAPVQVSITNPAPAVGGIIFDRHPETGRIMALRPSTAVVFERDADGRLTVEAQQ